MYTEDGAPSNTAFGPIATVVTYFGDDTGNTIYLSNDSPEGAT